MKRIDRCSRRTRHVGKQLTPIMSWKSLKVGDAVTMISDDFDGYCEVDCIVKEIRTNGAVAVEDTSVNPSKYLIDKYSEDMFFWTI